MRRTVLVLGSLMLLPLGSLAAEARPSFTQRHPDFACPIGYDSGTAATGLIQFDENGDKLPTPPAGCVLHMKTHLVPDHLATWTHQFLQKYDQASVVADIQSVDDAHRYQNRLRELLPFATSEDQKTIRLLNQAIETKVASFGETSDAQ